MQQSGRKRPAHLGTKLFLITGLSLLAVGIGLFFSMIHLQLQWKTFQLQFAACAYDVDGEDGWLKAVSDTETVNVAPKNATSLFKMVQTAKAASIGKLKNPVEQIHLEYSNSAHGTLSRTEDGRVHIDLIDANGKHWNFYLGACNFSSIRMILSVEGAAIENAVWTD